MIFILTDIYSVSLSHRPVQHHSDISHHEAYPELYSRPHICTALRHCYTTATQHSLQLPTHTTHQPWRPQIPPYKRPTTKSKPPKPPPPSSVSHPSPPRIPSKQRQPTAPSCSSSTRTNVKTPAKSSSTPPSSSNSRPPTSLSPQDHLYRNLIESAKPPRKHPARKNRSADRNRRLEKTAHRVSAERKMSKLPASSILNQRIFDLSLFGTHRGSRGRWDDKDCVLPPPAGYK
jgi:hypothetical protein